MFVMIVYGWYVRYGWHVLYGWHVWHVSVSVTWHVWYDWVWLIGMLGMFAMGGMLARIELLLAIGVM